MPKRLATDPGLRHNERKTSGLILHWIPDMVSNAGIDVSTIKTAAEARTYLDRVKAQGRDDLYPAAFRRLCELSGQDYGNPLVADFWKAIAAAEEVLRQSRGKTVRLSRTRQKIERVGVQKTVQDLALSKSASHGFAILTGAGLGDLTAEYLVLKHADHFSPDVHAAARARLIEAGVGLPAGMEG